MVFAVELKVPKRRSERIAKRQGGRAPAHTRKHARVIWGRRGSEESWHQFLPSIWHRPKVVEEGSEMKQICALNWVDEREDFMEGPKMQNYHRLSGGGEFAKRQNPKFKHLCQMRHHDLTYLGRENADVAMRELQQQFKWAPQLEHWERGQWAVTEEERHQHVETNALLIERPIKSRSKAK